MKDALVKTLFSVSVGLKRSRSMMSMIMAAVVNS